MSSILSDIETVIYKGDLINKAYNLKQRIKDQMVRFLFAKCENDDKFYMNIRLHSGSKFWIMNILKHFIKDCILNVYKKKSNEYHIKALFTLDNEDWMVLKENNLIHKMSKFSYIENLDYLYFSDESDYFYFSDEFEDEIVKYLMYRK